VGKDAREVGKGTRGGVVATRKVQRTISKSTAACPTSIGIYEGHQWLGRSLHLVLCVLCILSESTIQDSRIFATVVRTSDSNMQGDIAKIDAILKPLMDSGSRAKVRKMPSPSDQEPEGVNRKANKTM